MGSFKLYKKARRKKPASWPASAKFANALATKLGDYLNVRE